MLEVDNLRLRYPEMNLHVDLSVAAGECVAVIGPSGAGKSTLLALIAGFVAPESGAVRVAGEDITAWPAARRPVTTVFQEHNLFAHLDVAANVGLGIHPGLKLDGAGHAQVTRALEQVGLTGFRARLPGVLSGGERRRVALARVLVRRRPVLLLDEPFVALGPALRAEMLALVDELRRAENLTTILVSHHPGDARLAAARTAFLSNGRIAAIGPTEALLARRDLPALTDYLGDIAP